MNKRSSSFSTDELQNWLAINQLPGLSANDIAILTNNTNELSSILKGSQAKLQALGVSSSLIKGIHNIDWLATEKELVWGQQKNHHIISLIDDRYPKLLREINAPPLVLFVKGDLGCLHKPQIAIVGSRNPTVVGKEIAEQFAKYLAQAGLTITSGLALGIDAASHRGALETKGKTIAILGSGMSAIYPGQHKELAERIVDQGALVSEFSLQTSPRRANFPRRNRLISGLSKGVLVVEAAIRSGSLITARFALDQGREVFAIPGSIHNPLARGCHQLIRQGAKLVEIAQDILEELSSWQYDLPEKKGEIAKDIEIALDDDYKNLLSCVGFEATAVDLIVSRSGLKIEEVSSMLLLLELQGYVKLEINGYCKTQLF